MKNLSMFKKNLTKESTVREALSMLDIATLKGMIYFMRLKNTKENRKENLIEIICKDYGTAVKRFIKCFDDERYQLYKKLKENGGILENIEISEEKVYALVQTGIIFPAVINNKNVLFMPRETLDIIKSIDEYELIEMIKYNTQFIKKVHGLLYYYGYLTLDEIFDFTLKRKAAENIDNIFFLEIIYMSVLYYGQIQPEGMGFRHKNLSNCELMLEIRDGMSGIPGYKKISSAELIKAGKNDYIEWNRGMKSLRNFLVYDIAVDEKCAENEIKETWFDFNNGIDMESVCMMYIERYIPDGDEELQENLISRIMQMFIMMPNWILKGYSFEEIIRLERVAC